MSFADATFMIGYSRPEYEPMFVKRIFEAIFGLGFVYEVREFVVTPLVRPAYKKFYIYTINDDHPASIRLTDLINDYTFATIAYKHEWDRKTRKVVDRYWKVFHAPVWKTFTPYIMNETQLAKTIDPWSTEADPAFASTQLAQTLVFPPPMVRDETEGWTLGQPCKLERSSNEPRQIGLRPHYMPSAWQKELLVLPGSNRNHPIVVPTACAASPKASRICPAEEYDEEEDVSNDFDELAAAIAEFGEDYPGSIARPSPMVRCTSEPYPEFGVPTEMVRDESDRFNEPYRLRFEETEDSGTTKICRGEDPADYGIGPPPKLVRSSTSAEWFGAVSGNY